MELGKMAASMAVAPLNTEPDIRKPIDTGPIGRGAAASPTTPIRCALGNGHLRARPAQAICAARLPDRITWPGSTCACRLFARRPRTRQAILRAPTATPSSNQMSLTPKSAPVRPAGRRLTSVALYALPRLPLNFSFRHQRERIRMHHSPDREHLFRRAGAADASLARHRPTCQTGFLSFAEGGRCQEFLRQVRFSSFVGEALR